MGIRLRPLGHLKQIWRRRKSLRVIHQDKGLKESFLRVQQYIDAQFSDWRKTPYLLGRCNICGTHTAFFCENKTFYRESLVCAQCLTTSRYRSISRGILRAIHELTGISADSIAELDLEVENSSLRVYDTQVPFYGKGCAYPIPDMLRKCSWIDVHTSIYKPAEEKGASQGPSTTNQNLEELTYADDSFDVVITSDVMEHVRLDDRAHSEIRRVLRSGGVYLFTVPHVRDRRDSILRVAVTDPSDPSKDQFLMEKEFHGDANSEGGLALSYRAYGTDLDEKLSQLGFLVEYSKDDFPEEAIMNTELFYCRLSK